MNAFTQIFILIKNVEVLLRKKRKYYGCNILFFGYFSFVVQEMTEDLFHFCSQLTETKTMMTTTRIELLSSLFACLLANKQTSTSFDMTVAIAIIILLVLGVFFFLLQKCLNHEHINRPRNGFYILRKKNQIE